MRNGYNAKLLRKLRQVAFMADDSYVQRLDPAETIRLHSYEECVRDKRPSARISPSSRPRAT